MRRFANRRDSNEATILTPVAPLGGLWIAGPPMDGWLWDRRSWRLCEVKDPRKKGWADEFTKDQQKLILKLNERQIPYHVLRTEDDVLRLMNAKTGA